MQTTIREDAVKWNGRWYVPTSKGTAWVRNWAEFLAAGGVMNFSEDQTTVGLTLPEGCKFSIKFQR